MIIPGDQKLTLRESAKFIGMSYNAMLRNRSKIGIPIVVITRRIQFCWKSRLEAWVESRQTGSDGFLTK